MVRGDGARTWVGGRMTETFGGVEFWRVLVVRTIEERLNELERTRLDTRKTHSCWGWMKKLGGGKDNLDIRRR